ncbi:hypothetical protein KIL84_015394 [Mauremys mutica]|uniref:Uncharacterized protein n=1 Tax=Mauremys mutica TaxID=74926 RepID=A0A9D3WQE4_9SAUR|nr:hypothetical protein KIL84_015394 [Mauremys mutica]
MYSISHLKPYKKPPALGTEKRLSKENIQTDVGDIEKTVPSAISGKMGGNVAENPDNSSVINLEVTDTEENECMAAEEKKQVAAEVESSNPIDIDAMFLEDMEEKEWFHKVTFVQTHKVTARLEAKVRKNEFARPFMS